MGGKLTLIPAVWYNNALEQTSANCLPKTFSDVA